MGNDDGRGALAAPGRRVIAALCALALMAPVTSNVLRPVAAADPPASFSSVPITSWRVNGVGRAALKVGNVVYVGGAFSVATSPDGSQSVNRSNLAAFDATTGALITSFRADTDQVVQSIETDGTSLFIGGSFQSVSGVTHRRIAALDPVTGALRTSFQADTNGTVHSMAVSNGKLYVAGTFTTVNGTSRSRVAALSTVTGAVDSTFQPVANSTVRGIAVSPGGARVYLGGSFSQINGSGGSYLRAVDGVTGATMSPSFNSVTDYVVDLDLSPDGSLLLASHAGSGNRTSAYSTGSGNRIWRNVVDGDAQAVHVIGGTVFGGFHDGANGDGASRVAAYDLSNGGEDTGFHPTFDRFMGAWGIGGDASALVVAGDFSRVSGVRAEGFAIFRSGPPTQFVASVWGWESWRYLDNGSDQGEAWREPNFNHSSWRTGIGEFGYGNGSDRTRVSYGPSYSNKYITTYFRKNFTASATPSSAAIFMRVDDGAVVYVNGVETARDNMPSGSPSFTTQAYDRSGNSEGSSRYFWINPALIRAGTNTIAVEIHQSSPSSDDLTFFPTLVAFGVAAPNLDPVPVLNVDTASGDAPLPLMFDARASSDPDGSIAAWDLNFGDGSFVAGVGSLAAAGLIAHTYTAPGTYAATLTVTDDLGATAVATQVITANAPTTTTTTTTTTEPATTTTTTTEPATTTTTTTEPATTTTTEPTTTTTTEPTTTTTEPATTTTSTTEPTTTTTTSTTTTSSTTTTTEPPTTTTSTTVPGTTTTVVPPDGGGVEVASGAVWSYLDDGSDQGSAWSRPGFDVSSWATGVGEFGYGDGDEVTVVSYGPSASSKYRTTYFRTVFSASGVPDDLMLTLRVDDGAVVYLNGVEAARFNMGDGAVNYRTRATDAIWGSAERLDRTFVLDPSLVVSGSNVLAVEVHQQSGGSSDISFLASLTGTPGTTTTTTTTTEPSTTTTTTEPATTTTTTTEPTTTTTTSTTTSTSTTTTEPPTTTTSTTVPGTTTMVVPPDGRDVEVASGAVWSYLDDGSDQGSAWSRPGFDVSSWATGVGEFGYGDGDEVTVVSYGPSASSKYRTTYFRTVFSASGVPDDLMLTLRVDDGAVVYLNGVEAARFNMGDGAVNYRTRATDAIWGSAERLDRTFVLDPSLVVSGSNVLAVEVHQQSGGSSDISFLASLTGTPGTTTSTTVPGTTTTVVPPDGRDVEVASGAVWSYLDDGSDQGSAWSRPGFDVSSWATGVGEFGYGDGDEVTVVSYGPSASSKYRTTYFRTVFSASGVPDDLMLTLRVDDGAVVYLNGVEAARFNMGDGAVNYRTRATDAIWGSAERLDRTFVLDPSLVVSGSNVLAVEVHQQSGGSSDISFLASLTGRS